LHDIRLLPIPLSSREIRDQIMALRASALLGALRGQPPRDVDALVDAVGRVGALMQAYPQITEIDINPIVVDTAGHGILALDALITIGNG
jgi:acetate---CoA ligase (ADP-forming)